MLNAYENNNLADAFEKFEGLFWKSKKWIAATLIALILLVAAFLKACGQEVERGKTISIEKSKRFTTDWIVCIESTSGKRYSIKWNTHNYHSKGENIPKTWDIYTKRKRTFIKAVL